MKMKLFAVAALAGCFVGGPAIAETIDEDMNVTGLLIEACTLSGGSVAFDVDADPQAGPSSQGFDITVACDRPYRVTWTDGGPDGQDDLGNYGDDNNNDPLNGYLSLFDAEGNSVTDTDGPVGAGDSENRTADTVSFVATLSRDVEGQQGIAQAGDLDGTITLQVTY